MPQFFSIILNHIRYDMAEEKILVVDDEETLCEALQFNLEVEGYTVDVAYSAEQALEMPLTSYQLILLDVMMGKMSGFKFAQILQSDPATAGIPIIFCTAKDCEDDMVAGLNIGADDYITKPYSIRNVLARVRSVLRRSQRASKGSGNDGVVCHKGLKLDLQLKQCFINDQMVKLPRKEFEILAALLGSPGKVFTREELLSMIWEDDVIVGDRTIDVNITRLRQKIGPYGQNIITRSGYGYGFKI